MLLILTDSASKFSSQTNKVNQKFYYYQMKQCSHKIAAWNRRLQNYETCYHSQQWHNIWKKHKHVKRWHFRYRKESGKHTAVVNLELQNLLSLKWMASLYKLCMDEF